MFTCHGCTRHVLEGARKCPFCGAALRSSPSPFHSGLMVGAILGLTLVGCGEPDPGDEEGNSMTNTTPATASAGTSSSTSSSTGGATGTGVTGPAESEAEAADYGTAPPPSDTTTSAGTDTGSTTSAGQEAEAADYGGPASTSG